ncbi:MAG: hypothetical protein K6T35_10890, partial [Meiothermus silvanus]|nr:hypothetical protein [Allomeiothermus silvanus]
PPPPPGGPPPPGPLGGGGGAGAGAVGGGGLPGQWAAYAFTPQWPWLVEEISRHLTRLSPAVAQPGTLEALAEHLQRSDVGFVLGVLAGLDSR